MNYIIVDFEMNPVAGEYKEERQICRCEIIEIGAVTMDESFMVLGEFKTLVKPQYNDSIYKKYETLTGISTQMVSGAPTFATAYEMFVNWCESYGSDYEVYAWSENDYNQLTAEMELKQYKKADKMRPLENWFDFQKEYTEKLGLERIMSLEKALDYAGIEFEGHMHDALCDAKNTAELFAIVRNEERCNVVLKAVMGGLESDTIGGFNGMLGKQKKEEGEANVTTVLFDDQIEIIHDRFPIDVVKPLTDEDYFVRGSTALLDAVDSTVKRWKIFRNAYRKK